MAEIIECLFPFSNQIDIHFGNGHCTQLRLGMPEWIAFEFSLSLNEVIPLEYACFPILPSRIIRTEPSACKHNLVKTSQASWCAMVPIPCSTKLLQKDWRFRMELPLFSFLWHPKPLLCSCYEGHPGSPIVMIFCIDIELLQWIDNFCSVFLRPLGTHLFLPATRTRRPVIDKEMDFFSFQIATNE